MNYPQIIITTEFKRFSAATLKGQIFPAGVCRYVGGAFVLFLSEVSDVWSGEVGHLFLADLDRNVDTN